MDRQRDLFPHGHRVLQDPGKVLVPGCLRASPESQTCSCKGRDMVASIDLRRDTDVANSTKRKLKGNMWMTEGHEFMTTDVAGLQMETESFFPMEQHQVNADQTLAATEAVIDTGATVFARGEAAVSNFLTGSWGQALFKAVIVIPEQAVSRSACLDRHERASTT